MSAGQAHTYSFNDVQCTLVGPALVASMGGQSGVSKEGITIDPLEDIGHMDIGAGGEGMHSLHVGRPGKATIRLLKTSPVNSLLSSGFAIQASSAALWGKNTIVVTDNARGDIVTCLSCAFTKHTGVTWAEDGNYNEWSFNVVFVSFNLGDGG